MAPSSNAYFNPLTNALNTAHSGTGHVADFCEMIDGKSAQNIIALGASVAALASSRPNPVFDTK